MPKAQVFKHLKAEIKLRDKYGDQIDESIHSLYEVLEKYRRLDLSKLDTDQLRDLSVRLTSALEASRGER